MAAVTAWCAEHGVMASELTLQQRDLEQVFLEVTVQDDGDHGDGSEPGTAPSGGEVVR